MSTNEAIAVFLSYSLAEKKELLAWLSFDLTIAARDSYEVGQDGLTHPQRVRRINEVQHRVSSFLLALLRNDPHRYPDKVFINIILSQPDDAGLERQLNEAFTRLTTRIAPAARDIGEAAEVFAKG